jgi:hypothetical protein
VVPGIGLIYCVTALGRVCRPCGRQAHRLNFEEFHWQRWKKSLCFGELRVESGSLDPKIPNTEKKIE